MKISEIINEQPYENDGSMSFTTDGSLADDFGVVTQRTLDLQYTFLFSAGTVRGKKVLIYKLKNQPNLLIRGLVKVEEPSNDTGKYDVVLSFKGIPSGRLKIQGIKGNPIQEKRVFILDDYRGRGITAQIYQWIIKNGYYLISDREHFSDSKHLWKKIARETQTKYNVFVYDIDKGLLGTYNETNDGDIWSRGDDNSGNYIVLVLSKR